MRILFRFRIFYAAAIAALAIISGAGFTVDAAAMIIAVVAIGAFRCGYRYPHATLNKSGSRA